MTAEEMEEWKAGAVQKGSGGCMGSGVEFLKSLAAAWVGFLG